MMQTMIVIMTLQCHLCVFFLAGFLSGRAHQNHMFYIMMVINSSFLFSDPYHHSHHGHHHLLFGSVADAEDVTMKVIITAVSDAKDATMIVVVLVIIFIII